MVVDAGAAVVVAGVGVWGGAVVVVVVSGADDDDIGAAVVVVLLAIGDVADVDVVAGSDVVVDATGFDDGAADVVFAGAGAVVVVTVVVVGAEVDIGAEVPGEDAGEPPQRPVEHKIADAFGTHRCRTGNES